MRTLRRAWARLLGALGLRSDERLLHEELESHIAMQTDDNIRRGMTAEQIARTLTYTLEFTDPKERPEDATMFASPQWVQSVLDEGIEIVKRKNGLQ